MHTLAKVNFPETDTVKEQRGETDRQAEKKHKDAAKEEEKTPQSETAETLIQREQTVEGQTATDTRLCECDTRYIELPSHVHLHFRQPQNSFGLRDTNVKNVIV